MCRPSSSCTCGCDRFLAILWYSSQYNVKNSLTTLDINKIQIKVKFLIKCIWFLERKHQKYQAKESQGHCSDLTKRIAKTGTSGKHPQNCERDLMTVLDLPVVTWQFSVVAVLVVASSRDVDISTGDFLIFGKATSGFRHDPFVEPPLKVSNCHPMATLKSCFSTPRCCNLQQSLGGYFSFLQLRPCTLWRSQSKTCCLMTRRRRRQCASPWYCPMSCCATWLPLGRSSSYSVS